MLNFVALLYKQTNLMSYRNELKREWKPENAKITDLSNNKTKTQEISFEFKLLFSYWPAFEQIGQ